jgi:hypothetical protein
MLTSFRSALPPGAASARGAGAACAGAAGVAPAASGVAQFEQNFAPAAAGVPQLGQVTASGEAHSWQNFAPGWLSVPQLGQFKTGRVPQVGSTGVPLLAQIYPQAMGLPHGIYLLNPFAS